MCFSLFFYFKECEKLNLTILDLSEAKIFYLDLGLKLSVVSDANLETVRLPSNSLYNGCSCCCSCSSIKAIVSVLNFFQRSQPATTRGPRHSFVSTPSGGSNFEPRVKCVRKERSWRIQQRRIQQIRLKHELILTCLSSAFVEWVFVVFKGVANL